MIDFTQVQAGTACDQQLAWFVAGVLKVERVDGGDITRRQLRVMPNVDALTRGRIDGDSGKANAIIATACR
jgi:formyl-CoA transferase